MVIQSLWEPWLWLKHNPSLIFCVFSKDWAKITLQDYNKETPNVNYLVRQRSNSINDFILIFIRPGDPQRRVNMLSINKLDNGKFQVGEFVWGYRNVQTTRDLILVRLCTQH